MKQYPAEIICPECGTSNAAGAVHCAQCGRRLTTHGQASNVWGGPIPPPAPPQLPPPGIIDLTPVAAMSSQATTPIPSGDWNNGGSRPADPAPKPPPVWSTPPSSPPPSAPVTSKPGGPPGWLLGCMGLFIVLIVAAIFAGMVGRSYVRDQANDHISKGITTQLGGIQSVTVNAGSLTLTEAEINRQIKSFTGSLGPISDPVATINRDGIHIKFDVVGRSSEFTAQPIVRDGKIVFLNAKISGPARFVVNASTITAIAEEQLASLMARSKITPKSIVLSQGSLTVITTDSTGKTV